MKAKSLLFLSLLIPFSATIAQETFPDNGPRNASHIYHAFIHTNIFAESGKIYEDAVMLIRDERIQAIGKDVSIPKEAIIHDLNGAWIYPSFIELNSDYGLKPAVARTDQRHRQPIPQIESKKKGAYAWNEAVHPEVDASMDFQVNTDGAEVYRKKGVGVVLSHHHDGIFRGTSFIALTGDEKENIMMFRPKAANHYSFTKGSSKQTYPTSQMGSIALIRQTFLDAAWYAGDSEREEVNFSLDAVNQNMDLPHLFEVPDYLSALRADKIADEFSLEMLMIGKGDEYKRLQEIKETNAKFIIPLKFPLPYDVDNAYEAIDLSLRQMKSWEMAEYNARILHEAEVDFAISTKGLKPAEVLSGIQKLKLSGLSEDVILSALTAKPAEFVNAEDQLGKLAPSYIANFIVFNKPVTEKTSMIKAHWVNGKEYLIQRDEIDIRGTFNLNINKKSGAQLIVKGSAEKPKMTLKKGKEEIPVHFSLNGHEIKMRYKVSKDEDQFMLMSGQINDEDGRIWVGKAQIPEGNWVDWAVIKQEDYKKEEDSVDASNDTIPVAIPKINYPLGAYGFDSLPKAEKVLFKHATLWTNEDTGVVENMDICIANGKIYAIGKSLTAVGLFGDKSDEVIVVQAQGKHITSGIIDEHSHIAISRGVNESGQESSAEVSIADVVNPDDINIYRQLAGGVTAAQLLHGSANPIGGQSGLIKFRWGRGAEEMKIEDADPFIKFALGENVKQSNWGDHQRIRYPQTRMGVEQVFYDGFKRAKEYQDIWKIYNQGIKSKKNKKNPPIKPRVDLELEALSQILDSQRFITCHSYIQSEINMLMHVADSMGFRVNTFTHILEGYKVADRMKAHGVGGSTFSDWWAYKYEVNDAIPYNAALLHEHGIVTAINSDDAEMGRRLNQEAAKVVKYGGVSEEDAWKMVTLNPAKLLHLDDHMGSLKEGKDADIVVWSAHPLTMGAKAEKTYVDGIKYFDAERDKMMRSEIEKERAVLIQKMIASKAKNGKSEKAKPTEKKLYHCDSMEDEMQ